LGFTFYGLDVNFLRSFVRMNVRMHSYELRIGEPNRDPNKHEKIKISELCQ